MGIEKKADNRDHAIDLIKGIMICLVVFGHLIRGPISAEPGLFGYIHYFIYCVHMPVFVFVSGYLSKSGISARKLIKDLLLPYVLINIPILIVQAIQTGISVSDLFTPWQHTWYIMSLLCWRILCNLSRDKLPWLIIVSIAAAVGGVFLSSLVWYILSLGRTMMMFPLFAVGRIITPEQLKKWSDNRWKGLGLILFVIIAEVLLLVCNTVGVKWATHDYPASLTELGLKYLFFFLSVILFVGMYCLINAKYRQNRIERWGRNSMTVYLFHLFICMALQSLLRRLPTWGCLIAVSAGSIIITEVLSSEPVVKVYRWVINFIAEKVLRINGNMKTGHTA